MISFEDLLASKPDIHPGLWDINVELARFLDENVRPGMVTLETGAGLSTLVIGRKGVSSHIAITPSADEVQAIRRFFQQVGIDAAFLTTVASRSQDYLPTTDLPALDLVLIDGDWSFPVPFIDWYYTAESLKVGGVMVIDDTHMITRTILADFMRADAKWEEVGRYRRGQFAVYRKARHPIHDGKPAAQAYLYDVYPLKAVRRIPYHPVGRALRAATYRLPPGIQHPLRAFYRRLVR